MKPSLVCLIFGCLVLSAWQVLQVSRTEFFDSPPLPIGDGPDYESIGYSLSRGNGFAFAWDSEDWKSIYIDDGGEDVYVHLERDHLAGLTTMRPPLFPVLIASVYQTIGRTLTGWRTIRICLALAIGLSGGLAMWIAARLGEDFFEGRSEWVYFASGLTMLLAMLDRTVRTYAVDFLTEPLALLFTTLLAVIWMARIKPLGQSVLSGVIFGILVLARSLSILWIPGLIVLMWFAASEVRSKRERGFGIVLFLLVVGFCLLPWGIRNCWRLERFMPMGAQGVVSILGGYSDEALLDGGNWSPEPEKRLRHEMEQIEEVSSWSSLEREVWLSDRASTELKVWIQENWGKLPELVGLRIGTHFGPYQGTSLIWRIFVLIGAICLLMSGSRAAIWLVGLILINALVVALLYETGGRFLVPMYGIMYALAGFGATRVFEKIYVCFATRRCGNPDLKESM